VNNDSVLKTKINDSDLSEVV